MTKGVAHPAQTRAGKRSPRTTIPNQRGRSGVSLQGAALPITTIEATTRGRYKKLRTARATACRRRMSKKSKRTGTMMKGSRVHQGHCLFLLTTALRSRGSCTNLLYRCLICRTV
ncbi:hypothetical protein FGO68_gene5067 [Halteria grandinella]|uniref:Uncharacterized protein n=1 Tax=Halteria grandinella TaxID=5974 RepID=A0A8J8SVZ2_HALGN|nr:hypothetical protein FGO68_gene5067 [Halteria grandinella]